MADMAKALLEAQETMKELGEDYSSLMGPFGVLKRHAVEKDGALPAKTKKLIALSVAVAKGCDWCIAIHTKGALDSGATKDEIIEACFAAVLMDGGTTLTHMKLVLDAIKQFSE